MTPFVKKLNSSEFVWSLIGWFWDDKIEIDQLGGRKDVLIKLCAKWLINGKKIKHAVKSCVER